MSTQVGQALLCPVELSDDMRTHVEGMQVAALTGKYGPLDPGSISHSWIRDQVTDSETRETFDRLMCISTANPDYGAHT